MHSAGTRWRGPSEEGKFSWKEKGMQYKGKAEKKRPRLTFEAGMVFSPREAKGQDFELDMDAARFKARQGQAGTRYGGVGGYCANCGLSLASCTCGRPMGTSSISGYPVMNRRRPIRRD